MFLRCEAPHCMREAVMRRKFQDPRRGGNELAYINKHFCCLQCEEAIVEELERQAQYARLVN